MQLRHEKKPPVIYLHRNEKLRLAVSDCRTLLRISTLAPTKCTELVQGWPDFVGVKGASRHGVGGVLIGEGKECVSTVFRFEWPDDIKAKLNVERNRDGKLTNSDLEMAGLLLLWLYAWRMCVTSNPDRMLLCSAIINTLCRGYNDLRQKVRWWQANWYGHYR